MSVQVAYESQLIARLLADRGAYYEMSDVLAEDLFDYYADVFRAMASLVKEGRQITFTKVVAMVPHMKKDLVKIVKSYDPTVRMDEVLAELEETRRMRTLDNYITRASLSRTSEERLQFFAMAATDLAKSERTQFKEGYQVAKEVLKNLSSPKQVKLPTGFKYLDAMMNGLQPSDLVIVAGRTSQGKSSFALNMSQKMVDAGRAVVFISLEMNEGQLMTRMICSKSGIPAKDIEKGHGYAEVQRAVEAMEKEKFFIADVHNNSATHILGLIRGAVIRYGADVVIIDYLQLMMDKSVRGSREQEVGQMARALKNIAKELDIPVVLLSQLHRPVPGRSPYPTLSDLRDSGQVEEAADVVIFVYRPEMYGIEEYNGQDTKGLAEIIMAKGRNYGTGRFRCIFEDSITRFRDFHDTDGTQDPSSPETMEDEVPF